MSSLLGLNYYDDDEDDQQAENDMVTAEQSNNILVIKLNISVSLGKTSTVTYQDVDREETGANIKRKQLKESPVKNLPQTILISQKTLPPSPTVFSNLIRRRGNNNTVSQKPRYEESTSPKVGTSPNVTGNTLSPQSDTTKCPDKQEKHIRLNYYDDDEDDQQAENDMVTAEQSNNILVIKLNISVSLGKTSTVTYQDVDREETGANIKRKQLKESPVKNLPQTILISQKTLPPSPTVFSNLIRRRGNNNTVSQKPRYEESTSPKVGTSPNVTGNTLSPQSDTTKCPDKQEKHISDDKPIIPNEQILADESEDARQHSAMRQLLTPKPIEGRENWGIPPEPESECDPILQEKIDHFHSLSKKGVHFNENLLKNKAFRNPHIYNKLVEFVELDEIGSNFDREIFDPYGFPSEAFADQLAQKKILEERAAAQQQQ
ncbi:11371_t:CDS:2, partial [Racocetra fulgida]